MVPNKKLRSNRKILFESNATFEEYQTELKHKLQNLRDNDDIPINSNAEEVDLWFSDTPGGVSFRGVSILYAVIRDRKPNHVVETGVRNGNSSLASLLALEENGSGTLHSIDLPGGSVEPLNNEVGWIIPNRYKNDWDLRLGKSQELLPKLRTEIDEIDLFIHDSEHSHSCMMFEFELAWYWLSPDGVILSDDVNRNSAFKSFCKEKQAESGFIEQSFGFVIR